MTSAVSSWVSAPTATPPGGAAASRRAAVLTASPVRKPAPEAGVDVEAYEGLAGVDADAHLRGAAVGAGHALERRDDAQAGADGAFGVVLVHGGHAEDADHGIADELLDGAAVGLDHLARGGVVPTQDGVDVLRVGGLAHGSEGDEVAEEGGDGLALLGDRQTGRQPGPALGAEGEVVRGFEAASRDRRSLSVARRAA